MSESNEEIKKMEERIAKLDAQQKQLKAKKRALRNRISQQNRKARTKRLIEKGAMLEKFQGDKAEQTTPEAGYQALVDLQHKYGVLVAYAKTINMQGGGTAYEHFLDRLNTEK